MNFTPNSAINYNHIKMKSHSQSMSVLDDKSCSKNKKNKKIKKQDLFKQDSDDNDNGNISSTYDEDVIDNTDSDYLSSDDEIFGDGIGTLNIEKNIKLFNKRNGNKRKSKINGKKASTSRPRANTVHFLGIPNGDNFIIKESEFDDDFDENTLNFGGSDNTLNLPKIPKMHLRSYSESNLQKNIQENQWPSTASSEDSFDGDSANNDVYSHYVSMKKKYKKQRRISKQFQEAITVIQDNNEDSMVITEQQIRDQFEKEYEIKLIQLEHQKLNNAMHIEDKMKSILVQNDQLMTQNKQLQQQVAAQVSMIQQQQAVTLQQQQVFIRMRSGDSMLSPTSSISLAALNQFPSTMPALSRHISSTSTINSTPALPLNIKAAMTTNLGLISGEAMTPSQSSQDDHYTLNYNDSNGSDDNNDELSISVSLKTDSSNSTAINSGDMDIKYNTVNMEPSSKYGIKKRNKYKSNRKKLKEFEVRLLQNDHEIREKIGDGQTPWDRFLNLMTPSFCSCSPAQNQQKSVAE